MARLKIIIGLLLLFLGSMIHSQYIAIAIFIIIANYISRLECRDKDRFAIKLLLFLSLIFTVFLLNIKYILPYITSIFNFLPSSKVAIAKLHYFSNARVGFRFTSLLSIFVFPALLYFLMKMKDKGFHIVFKEKNIDNVFFLLLCASVFFGFVVNLLFFSTPHVAGRLSRYSDYIAMGIITPAFLNLYFGYRVTVIIGLSAIAVSPFLYPSLYVS